MTTRTVNPPDGAFRAEVDVPADKSLSHRALIFAGMAAGASRVRSLGPGRDVAATAAMLQQLGVTVRDGSIESPGVEQWREPSGVLDAGNSGTTLRVMTGVLAGRPFRSVLDGDDSLRRRPMERLVGPLAALGAEVTTAKGGVSPVEVRGGELRGAVLELGLPSAQVRTAIELAAVQAEGSTTVDSPPGFRDHTERWMAHLGRGRWEAPTRFRVDPGALPPLDIEVPADPSSAAFLWAAAAAVQGASVVTPRVSLNHGRTGFLDVLAAMGATVEAEVTGAVLGDPVGDVTVVGAGLVGVEIGGALTIRVLDELPLVAVLAGLAEGETVVHDAVELRVKESDRIESTVQMIQALGGIIEPHTDGFAVSGVGEYRPATLDPHGDHRIAMAGAVAAARATGPIHIEGADAAGVSWPGFFEVLESSWSSR